MSVHANPYFKYLIGINDALKNVLGDIKNQHAVGCGRDDGTGWTGGNDSKIIITFEPHGKKDRFTSELFPKILDDEGLLNKLTNVFSEAGFTMQEGTSNTYDGKKILTFEGNDSLAHRANLGDKAVEKFENGLEALVKTALEPDSKVAGQKVQKNVATTSVATKG